MFKLLVIQTAFTGDVVLATAVVEKLHTTYPGARIDFLLRKGNEGILQGHPYIQKVYVWDKKKDKNKNLFNLVFAIRKEKYTHVINLHRFGSSGLVTFLSGAPNRVGFDKNPFSFCYTKKAKHIISPSGAVSPLHEIDRNQLLIADFTDSKPEMPKLYPSQNDYALVKTYQNVDYICIAPSSVWFTKQFPPDKWVSLINELPTKYAVYIIGGGPDEKIANEIVGKVNKRSIHSFCGQFSYLQSAALMQGAVMNYVNDSAPLHFASAMNAPVIAVFCSTVPTFGFGPLMANGSVVQVNIDLPCRPCGLHGFKACPKGHFKCAYEITNKQLLCWETDLKTT